MPCTALELKKGSASEWSLSSLAVDDLPYWIEQWLLDGECRLLSSRSINTNRCFLDKFHWFLNHRNLKTCGIPELRQFFAYLVNGHKEPGGRWGNPQLTKPLRPVSIKDYYCCLRAFFAFLESNGAVAANPIQGIPKPIARTNQKPPLSREQLQALLQAARNGAHPKRDEAILLFLLDTGVRASELVSLTVKDVDLSGRRCHVLGKGNKYRTVFLGSHTARVLAQCLRARKREANDPIFLSERKQDHGAPLTRSGLQQLLYRLAKAARIGEPVSPHGLRRTFAVEILKNGANVFSLREMLGHTNLQMTQKYLLLAQADVEAQHRQYSPADCLQQKNLDTVGRK